MVSNVQHIFGKSRNYANDSPGRGSCKCKVQLVCDFPQVLSKCTHGTEMKGTKVQVVIQSMVGRILNRVRLVDEVQDEVMVGETYSSLLD